MVLEVAEILNRLQFFSSFQKPISESFAMTGHWHCLDFDFAHCEAIVLKYYQHRGWNAFHCLHDR